MKKSLTVIMAGVFLSGGILFGSDAKADENLKPHGKVNIITQQHKWKTVKGLFAPLAVENGILIIQ